MRRILPVIALLILFISNVLPQPELEYTSMPGPSSFAQYSSEEYRLIYTDSDNIYVMDQAYGTTVENTIPSEIDERYTWIGMNDGNNDGIRDILLGAVDDDYNLVGIRFMSMQNHFEYLTASENGMVINTEDLNIADIDDDGLNEIYVSFQNPMTGIGFTRVYRVVEDGVTVETLAAGVAYGIVDSKPVFESYTMFDAQGIPTTCFFCTPAPNSYSQR